MLKKISLVYTLQIFAVILLLGYAVATPVNSTKEPVTNGIMPSKLTKPMNIIKGDSILTGKTIELGHVNAAKSR